MFDILSFFKKKPPVAIPSTEASATPVEAEVKIDSRDIHVMPERFRHHPAKANKAQTMGLLIIGGGVVFLIGASVFMYYYLFKAKPTVVEAPVATNQTEATDQTQTVEQNNLTEPVLPETTLPTDTGLATTTASTTPENYQGGETVALVLGLDFDNDGLTEPEEIIFGTSTSTPDTDNDGYFDGSEVLSLYDPANTGKLTGNLGIKTYENKTFYYSVLYPVLWETSVNGGDDSVMFKSSDNQFMQIIVAPNAGNLTLDQWYLDQMEVAEINPVDRLSSTVWQGIMNPDGLTAYLMDTKQKYIFTIGYIPGENNVLDYGAILKMMIKSFTLLN